MLPPTWLKKVLVALLSRIAFLRREGAIATTEGPENPACCLSRYVQYAQIELKEAADTDCDLTAFRQLLVDAQGDESGDGGKELERWTLQRKGSEVVMVVC